ncbi:hypothetical protein D3C71_1622150 [compost metagenome]
MFADLLEYLLLASQIILPGAVRKRFAVELVGHVGVPHGQGRALLDVVEPQADHGHEAHKQDQRQDAQRAAQAWPTAPAHCPLRAACVTTGSSSPPPSATYNDTPFCRAAARNISNCSSALNRLRSASITSR